MGIFDSLGGGFNMLNSFMHPEKGYEAAGDEARKAWEEGQQYEKPYWQRGNDQYDQLSGAEGRLLDPGALEGDWMKGYEESPYARQATEANRTAGLDAASSMGLMGSSAALNNIQVGAGNIASADRQQYLNDLMQKYMTGIGIGQNIYGYGAQAGNNLLRGRMESGRMTGQARYGQFNAPGEMLGRIAGQAAGAYAGSYARGGK